MRIRYIKEYIKKNSNSNNNNTSSLDNLLRNNAENHTTDKTRKTEQCITITCTKSEKINIYGTIQKTKFSRLVCE